MRNLYTELLLRTRLGNYSLPRWRYNFTVPQLIFLCDCIESTCEAPGCIVEVGCATGATTLFVNKFMDAKKIEKPFFCIDTFAGFLDKDIEYEALKRGKDPEFYKSSIFRLNKKEWFDEIMRLNSIKRVQTIQADASDFDFAKLGGIAFCLLDVDLYIPTSKSLPRLFQVLDPNGLIVVDDCDPNVHEWDGALQAYCDFMAQIDQPIDVVLNKLGIIRKRRDTG